MADESAAATVTTATAAPVDPFAAATIAAVVMGGVSTLGGQIYDWIDTSEEEVELAQAQAMTEAAKAQQAEAKSAIQSLAENPALVAGVLLATLVGVYLVTRR